MGLCLVLVSVWTSSLDAEISRKVDRNDLYLMVLDIVPLEGSFPVIKTGYRTKMWRIGPLCRYSEDISLVLKV